jgi:hypothetical protein
MMTKRPVSWGRALSFLVGALGLALALVPTGCRNDQARRSTSMSAPSRSIVDVLAEHSPRIIAMSGVTAIGEGRLPDGRPCIQIFIREKDPTLEARLPRTIEGYPVVVEVSGQIRALPDSG